MGDGKASSVGPWSVEGVEVAAVGEVRAGGWDALVVVLTEGVPPPQAVEDVVAAAREVDRGIDQTCAVIASARVCGGRLVLAPTGPITPYHDVRSIGEAARAGVKRALEAGAARPVLALQPHPAFPRAPLVALLGALEALYVPLQSRESFPALCKRASALGVYAEGLSEPLTPIINDAVALETARVLARDVGGADPERMTALSAAQYLRERFASTSVRVRVLDDASVIREQYPLFAAVSRAADKVPRHRGVGMGDGKASSVGPWSVEGVEVAAVGEVRAGGWDALVVVLTEGVPPPQAVEDVVAAAREVDRGIDQTCAVIASARVCGGRLVLAPTGPITPYHDVRSIGEAARAGVKRALEAGAARPVLALQPHPAFPRAPLVALLGALEALYVPLQSRESFPALCKRASALGVYAEGLSEPLTPIINDAVALETARVLARDVGGADPERMTALSAAQYLRERFASTSVRVRVLDDASVIREQYPLFAAVSRAADKVPRHRGCIVFLEYVPEKYEKTLMFVGKGVTYDTGGCDVKVGGAMVGMSRDKCGAANVAGFLMACELLRPPLKVVAALGFARNSIGSEAYVADELLTARCGRVVRVGNTDAEGRMVMGDLLCEMRERAATELSPHVYTVATLTGHAHRAYGAGYTAAADSHAAAAHAHADKLRHRGALLGDMIEVSRIRREDLSAHRASHDAELLQASPCPSTLTPRGHQAPAAFLLQVGKLETVDAPPYTHLDIAASAGEHPAPPTAAPLLALAAFYDLVRL